MVRAQVDSAVPVARRAVLQHVAQRNLYYLEYPSVLGDPEISRLFHCEVMYEN